MKLHYKGKYNLNPESLPSKPHQPGAVPFKEANDTKTMAIIANIIAVILFVFFGVILYIRIGKSSIDSFIIGCIISLLCMFPHELLHALCFKEDVYLYTNLKQGMLFVVGPETMSKSRFIILSLLPNLVFGFIPYILTLIVPSLTVLGYFGLTSITMGAGDYYNVFNAVTQMPKGAKTYLYQFNSYWYMPNEDNNRYR